MRSRRPLLMTLGAALLLAPAPAAVAQDASPSPAEMSPMPQATGADVDSPQAAELLALFPTEVGGQPITETPLVVTGQDLIADLDPEDEDDARELAQLELLLEAAGATIEDVTSASVLVELEGDAFALVGAFRIEGSDALETLDAFVDAFSLDVTEPLAETDQIAGRDVVLVSDSSRPDADPFIFFGSGDVTWIVVAPEALREEIIESLP